MAKLIELGEGEGEGERGGKVGAKTDRSRKKQVAGRG